MPQPNEGPHSHANTGGCTSCRGLCKEALKEGIYKNNPVTCQVLGICSCLASETSSSPRRSMQLLT